MNYKNKFYKTQKQNITRSAEIIVPIILEYVRPKSVLDVGCGCGHFLKVFLDHHVPIVRGVDNEVPLSELVIPEQSFQKVNLETDKINYSDNFDLIICLEVAEHLSEESGKNLINQITSMSPYIVFSAAIPAQGGTHHINEQWQSYWINLFKEKGFICVDCFRKRLWDLPLIDTCYKQNMFLFVYSGQSLSIKLREEKVKSLNVPDNIVHPDLYRHEDIRSVPLKRALGAILYKVFRK